MKPKQICAKVLKERSAKEFERLVKEHGTVFLIGENHNLVVYLIRNFSKIRDAKEKLLALFHHFTKKDVETEFTFLLHACHNVSEEAVFLFLENSEHFHTTLALEHKHCQLVEKLFYPKFNAFEQEKNKKLLAEKRNIILQALIQKGMSPTTKIEHSFSDPY